MSYTHPCWGETACGSEHYFLLHFLQTGLHYLSYPQKPECCHVPNVVLPPGLLAQNYRALQHLQCSENLYIRNLVILY
jgi:hypothetical protein